MHPKTLMEQTRKFERDSRLADDKAKADIIASTPAKIGATVSPAHAGMYRIPVASSPHRSPIWK